MIDWVTAIIPCLHDGEIYGGSIASVDVDGVIEWRVDKKKQVRGSYESNLNIKSISNTEILLDGNPESPPILQTLISPSFELHLIDYRRKQIIGIMTSF